MHGVGLIFGEKAAHFGALSSRTTLPFMGAEEGIGLLALVVELAPHPISAKKRQLICKLDGNDCPSLLKYFALSPVYTSSQLATGGNFSAL